MKRFQRFGLSELLRNDAAVFVPVDYGAAKLPFLTISTLYADSLKYQHIGMLTFVNTDNKFSNVCYLLLFIYEYIVRCLFKISTYWYVNFCKYR